MVAAFAPAALFAGAMLPSTAQAAKVTKGTCNVHAVLGTKDGDKGIPKELGFLNLDADEFAIYKSWYLVDKKALDIKLGEATDVKFRSGNRLGLTLLDNDDKRLKVHLKLTSRDGEKDLLSAAYSTVDGAALMIGAGAYTHDGKTGKLFFAIQCARSG